MYKVINNSKTFDNKGYGSLLSKILLTNKYLLLNEKNLFDPFKIRGIKEASLLIKNTIKKKEKIMVYGDFDCDGFCATSIIVSTIKKLGGDVGYFIPNRYKEGYGIDKNIVKKVVEKDYSLFMSVDCGVKNKEEIEFLNKNNIKTIVLDHHQNDEDFKSSDILIHPDDSPFKLNTSAGALSFFLSYGLLKTAEPYFLSLAGVSILSDSMPLIGQNMLIAKKAIENFNKYKFNNLEQLKESKFEYDEFVLSYEIIPKINSVGRMINTNKINKVVEFLMDHKNPSTKNSIFINSTNQKRKATSRKLLNSLENYEKNPFIIEKLNILEGISGLVASSLSNKYQKFTCIFASNDKNILKGSIRGFDDELDVLNILNLNKDLIEKYGGHKSAAGLSIKNENYDEFKQRLADYFKNFSYKDKEYEVIEVLLKDLTYENYLELDLIRPFGEKNSEPLFLLKNINSDNFKLSRNKKHIYFKLNKNLSFICFNKSDFEKNQNYDLIFKLNKNNMYRNSLQGVIIELIKSS